MRVSPGGGGSSDAGACEDDGPGRVPGTTAVPPRLSVRFLARGRGGVLTARSAVTGPPVRFYWGPLARSLFFRRLAGDGRVDACRPIVLPVPVRARIPAVLNGLRDGGAARTPRCPARRAPRRSRGARSSGTAVHRRPRARAEQRRWASAR